MLTIPTLTLNDGTPFPELGLGTYKLTGEEGIAANYDNEREVGEAVRRSTIDRDELIVATKIPGRAQGYDEAIESTNGSLSVLGLDRIDLSLIHWPNPSVDRYVDTWRAMIALRDEGKLRSIGVSNFT